MCVCVLVDVTFVSNKLVTTPVGAPEGFMFTSLALFPSADNEADVTVKLVDLVLDCGSDQS